VGKKNERKNLQELKGAYKEAEIETEKGREKKRERSWVRGSINTARAPLASILASSMFHVIWWIYSFENK
jgi:hypothetical protein